MLVVRHQERLILFKPPFHPDPSTREQARQHPNGWVYEIDGDINPNGNVPPEKIRGAWKVDSDGQLTGEYMPNQKHPFWKNAKFS